MRICESFAAFMPVVFIFLLVLLFVDGEQTLLYFSEEYKNYDYITTRKHSIWLNFNSVFIRSVLLVGTLHILTYYYLYHSILLLRLLLYLKLLAMVMMMNIMMIIMEGTMKEICTGNMITLSINGE